MTSLPSNMALFPYSKSFSPVFPSMHFNIHPLLYITLPACLDRVSLHTIYWYADFEGANMGTVRLGIDG
jgi:hypothetical protein